MISLERGKSLTLFVISVVFATCLIIVLNFDTNVYSFELFVNWNNTTNKARLSRRNNQYHSWESYRFLHRKPLVLYARNSLAALHNFYE